MTVTQTYLDQLESDLTQKEDAIIAHLMDNNHTSRDHHRDIFEQACALTQYVREQGAQDLFDKIMGSYDLSTDQGLALMRMAETLIRIPDEATAIDFLQDILKNVPWDDIAEQQPRIVKWIGKALTMSGKTLSHNDFLDYLGKKQAVSFLFHHIIKHLGHKFVFAESFKKAYKRAKRSDLYAFSFDMLGEAVLTTPDAEKFYNIYLDVINHMGKKAPEHVRSLSVKLSALHPRYHYAHMDKVFQELLPRLKTIVQKAQERNIQIIIDAEEVERLHVFMHIFESLVQDPELQKNNSVGFAVQAYQKRAFRLLDWAKDISESYNIKIPIRLVKGAYWDNEIKYAQQQGWSEYPVFTRKCSTDLSFLACAEKMFRYSQHFTLLFGTHNPFTIFALLHMQKTYQNTPITLQKLHGMADLLYKRIRETTDPKNVTICVYAPVGQYDVLLPYLVRRLLENGANSSFVNKIQKTSLAVSEIIDNPYEAYAKLGGKDLKHPRIPLPKDIFGDNRLNSHGPALFKSSVQENIQFAISSQQEQEHKTYPIINGHDILEGAAITIVNPADKKDYIGPVIEVSSSIALEAYQINQSACDHWAKCPVKQRADILRRAADLMEERWLDYCALLVREAGKIFIDAISEIREAIDFLRYYAKEAESLFDQQTLLPSVTGEENKIYYHPRGVFSCIAPWNFPLAIFMGQISAALVTGNTVIAKPAEQTPHIAYKAIRLLLEAGIPKDVISFLPGDGALIGKEILSQPDMGGVAFTGSFETAKMIQRTLANHDGPIVPLIAETGGQNVMIVDSSALIEQTVENILISSFQSAGQRCSALRVLYVQENIADCLLTMLVDALKERVIGNPSNLKTDIGPVIDGTAQKELANAIARRIKKGQVLYQQVVDPALLKQGTFVTPTIIKLSHISELNHEHFGPLLHVITYKENELESIIDDVKNTGFGLTMGIQTRLDQRYHKLFQKVTIGNVYVNRDMIGAVVGSQPFGGEGYSGTGPKAGGPNYLSRFVTERVLTVNTTAFGGNTSLLNL